MRFDGLSALVTGANRGIGAAFVEVLLDRGAATVHAGARDPSSLARACERHGARLVPVRLDVTDAADVARVGASLDGLDLLVSNAGQASVGPVVGSRSGVAPVDEPALRAVFDVNVFGPLALLRALAPALRARRGGVLVVHSLAALVISRSSPVYSASKAAAAMLAMGARDELRADGVTVTSVFPGFVDTDITASMDLPKAPARLVAERSLSAWSAGSASVFPDRMAEIVRAALGDDVDGLLTEPQQLMSRLVATFRADPRAGD